MDAKLRNIFEITKINLAFCSLICTFVVVMSDYLLNELNEGQRKAVEYCEGPQLVIAGAGAGKTRVLTYKIAYLLEQGLAPWNILALTFTNKAAREMKERIGRIVGQDSAVRLQMGTFHSVFARILRVEADIIGFGSNFTIYDQTDAREDITHLHYRTTPPRALSGSWRCCFNHKIAFYKSTVCNVEKERRLRRMGKTMSKRLFTFFFPRLAGLNFIFLHTRCASEFSSSPIP